MLRNEIDKTELEAARAALARLRDAPEVRDLLRGPAGRDPVRDHVRNGAIAVLLAAGAVGVVLFAIETRHVGPKLLLLLGGAALSLLLGIREFWTAWRLSFAATRAALGVVVVRSRERSSSESEGDRFRATIETAGGVRVVFRGLAFEAWNALVPGHAFVVWSRGAELADLQDLGAVTGDAPASAAGAPSGED